MYTTVLIVGGGGKGGNWEGWREVEAEEGRVSGKRRWATVLIVGGLC